MFRAFNDLFATHVTVSVIICATRWNVLRVGYVYILTVLSQVLQFFIKQFVSSDIFVRQPHLCDHIAIGLCVKLPVWPLDGSRDIDRQIWNGIEPATNYNDWTIKNIRKFELVYSLIFKWNSLRFQPKKAPTRQAHEAGNLKLSRAKGK